MYQDGLSYANNNNAKISESTGQGCAFCSHYMVITVSHALPPSKTRTDGAATVGTLLVPMAEGKGAGEALTLAVDLWPKWYLSLPFMTHWPEYIAQPSTTTQWARRCHPTASKMGRARLLWTALMTAKQHMCQALSEVQAHSLHLRSIHSYWRAGYITQQLQEHFMRSLVKGAQVPMREASSIIHKES